MSTQPQSQPSSSSLPPPKSLHQGSAGASFEIADAIDANACVKEYYQLEECLGEHDRSFKACQHAVLALKTCNSKRNQVNQNDR